MMKKRIVALLLAGLMTTTALASCRVQGNFEDPNGTEPNQTTPSSTQQTTPAPDDPYTPPVVTWQDVDKSVYTVKDVTLRQEASNTSTSLGSIPKETKLHCTKQNATWYYVEYNGNQGYVSIKSADKNVAVTEVDILASDFTPVEGDSKVMYANAETINVRLYPSQATFSDKVGSFKLNDQVTVIAENKDWYKVKYVKNGEEKDYFVSKDCLDDHEVVNPNDDSIYKDLFTDVNGNEGVEKYVYYKLDNGEGGKVNFRQSPNLKSTIIMSLSDGVKVTVLKTGVVDGKAWSYIIVKVESDKVGVPSEYKKGYISSDCLSDTSGDMNLDEFIEYYGFNKIDGGIMYYVLKEATINIRSTPSFPNTDAGEENNLITSLQSGQTPESIKALNVVATKEVNDTTWFLVEYTKKEGDKDVIVRGFVGGKALEQLTTDKDGERVVTIQDLQNKYPSITILETSETKTAASEAKCFGTPDGQGTVLGTINAGTEVTVVAKETGAFATWYVIQTEEGKLFFVGIEFFN